MKHKDGNERILLFLLNISQADERQYRLCYQTVSEQRKQRADRYRFPEDQRRCVFSEMLLRYAYRQNGGDPDGMRIVYPKGGKPYLSSDPHFRFNISHTGNMIALVCGNEPLGVDIEHIKRALDRERMAELIFTEDERHWLGTADSLQEQNERFFRLWTAKESYLKYLGTGLLKNTKSFSVDPERHSLKEDEEIRFTEKTFGEYIVTVCGKTDLLRYESLTLSDVGITE